MHILLTITNLVHQEMEAASERLLKLAFAR